MIDFHTHILPSVDDGSRNIEETFNLIKEAKEAGFQGIVLTPHYINGYYETDVKEREVLLKAIKDTLQFRGVNPDLYLANEIFISDDIMDLLIDRKASSINNSCYVLFELPLNADSKNLFEVIYNLQENKLIPVLAHPERYKFVQKNPSLINDLIENGVLMQANYGSVLGQYGNRAQIIVKKLLEANMIHFLGSDVHRENTIYQFIPNAIEIIKDIIGEDKLYEITTQNPKLAIDNKRIEIRETEEIKLSFKEKISIFFKR